MLGSERCERASKRFDPLRPEHAEYLTLHTRGIGERAEHVEDRADTQRCPHRRHMAHRCVVRRRKHEGEACVAEARRNLGVGRIEIDAERLEHVRRAGLALGAVAVLGDLCACARSNKRYCCRRVERRPAQPTCAARIDGALRRRHRTHIRAQHAGARDDVGRRLSTNAERHEKRRHQGRISLARKDRLERGRHLCRGRTATLGKFRGGESNSFAHLRPAFLRKFASIVLPC